MSGRDSAWFVTDLTATSYGQLNAGGWNRGHCLASPRALLIQDTAN